MSSQMTVVIAGIVLVVAIVVALVIMRRGDSRFTYDTQHGTAPRATEGEGNTAATAFKGRFSILTTGVGTMFAALAVKLWGMQMVSSDYYDKQAQSNQTRTVTTPAVRGRILDRNGVALVQNRPSLAVVAYRDLAGDKVLVRHLANVLGMPYVAVLRNIQDNSEGAQSLHTIATDVRRSTVAYIQEHAGEFPGVKIAERTERQYPYGETACHILGYTGTITSEQLEAQKKKTSEDASESAGKIAYQSGDIVGQAGVESYYENLLQGIRGEQTVKVDASGNVTGQAGAVPPRAGSDVKLTIDLAIQQACETALVDAIARAKQSGYSNAGNGAVVCLDPNNGEILGMASEPKFDPSVFIGGVSNDVWTELNDDEGSHPLLNRVISGQYMSASTIKPLTSLAALEYGTYTSSQTTDCTGYWTGLGKQWGKYCWLHSGHGTMTLQSGIANSCDPVFYDIGKAFFYDKDNPEGLQEMFRRWGLGSTCGIDLPSEGAGRIPDAEWKESFFADASAEDRKWNAGDMTNIAIGQGDILVTPLQMACAYMGLANGGKQFTPHVFLSAVSRDGDGGDAYTYNGKGSKKRLTAKINSDADLTLVRNGMHDVIYSTSATTASHFTNLTPQVYGKSGTGEKSGEDEYSWFCAYAPADDPKYVIATVLEQGGGGSAIALHVVRDVLGAIYNEPDTSSATGDSSVR